MLDIEFGLRLRLSAQTVIEILHALTWERVVLTLLALGCACVILKLSKPKA